MLYKYRLSREIKAQKIHGKNLIGTIYFLENVFIKIFLLDYFFLSIFRIGLIALFKKY